MNSFHLYANDPELNCTGGTVYVCVGRNVTCGFEIRNGDRALKPASRVLLALLLHSAAMS